MESLGLREQNKLRTRVALATAAVRLFKTQGYEATTVEDIARAANSSPATFFRYFGTKEDVLFFDAGEILEDFRTFVGEPIPGLTRWAQIKIGIVRSVLRFAEPSPELKEGIITGLLSEPALGRRLNQVCADIEGIIVSALSADRGIEPDDLRIQLTARATTAVWMSAFYTYAKTGGDLSELMDDGFALIENGIAPADKR